MSRSVGLLLGVILLGAVASIVFLLADGPMGGSSSWLGRDGPARGTDPDLLDPGAARLAAARNAKPVKTEEELAAERAAASAPTFAKSEGVHGTVTNGRGEPIADAHIKLMEAPVPGRQRYGGWGQPDPPAIAEARSNAKGEFLVGPAEADTFLKIRADAPGYAATVRNVKCRGYRVDLVLDVGGALTVETKDSEGEPIAAARVLHQAGDVVTEATTDEEGRVELTNLPTGDGTVLASAPGHSAVTQGGVGVSQERAETVTLVLSDPLVIEGIVTAEDGFAPLEGVTLCLDHPNMPWLERSEPVTTDETGAFELQAYAGLNQYASLEATAEEYAPYRTWVQLQDSGGGRMKVDVKLSGLRAPVSGRVVDANGHSVGGAEVTYAPRGMPDEKTPTVTAGGDGTFELPAPPWALQPGQSVRVLASAPGKGVGSGRAQVAKIDALPEPVTVKLGGVGRVSGSVVDGAGGALPGSLVTLLLDWQAMREGMQSGRYDSSAMNAINNPSITRLDAVTDDEGKFAMEDVPCAMYRVQAEYGLDRITAEEPLTVGEGGVATCTIEFKEGATIEGFVLDSEDRPVPGASVNASPSRGGGRGRWSPGGYLTARAQNDGRFVLHGASLPSYDLSAYASGYESNAEKDIAPGRTDLTLRLKPQGWVVGEVEMNGVGYRGTFTVRALPVKNQGGPPQPGFSGWRPGSRQNTFSPDDGQFELRGLSAGEYDLTVTTPEGSIGVEAVRVAVADGRESRARLALTSGASVIGRLTSAATGLPIPKARISVMPSPQAAQVLPSGSAMTDAEGRFVVRGLGMGPYVVHVWPPSGMGFQQALELASGETRTLELHEEAPGALRILVVDDSGAAVVGVQPIVTGPGGNQVWPNWNALRKEGMEFTSDSWRALMVTDETGVNVRRHLPPGRYTVTAKHGGYAPAAPVTVDVRSDREAEIEVGLTRTGAASNPGN